jgi:hypothetical protein
MFGILLSFFKYTFLILGKIFRGDLRDQLTFVRRLIKSQYCPCAFPIIASVRVQYETLSVSSFNFVFCAVRIVATTLCS